MNNRSRVLIFAISIIILLVCLAGIIHFNTVQDDAFISFQYTKNLIEGWGLVFNIGERVEGYTNFLWVLLFAPILALGIDPWDAAPYVSIPFALLTIVIVLRVSLIELGHPLFIGIIAAITLALHRAFLTASTGGLETALFTFLVTASLLYAFARFERNEPLRTMLGLVLFLMCLTRPEGYLISAAIVAGDFVRTFAAKRPFQMKWLVLFGLLSVIYNAWHFWYFGKLLPNTFYAKKPSLDYLPIGIDYLLHFISTYGYYLLLLPLLWLLISAKGRQQWLSRLWAISILGAYFGYIAYVGGDFLEFRFVAPMLPFSFVLMQHGIYEYLAASRENSRGHAVTTVAALLLLLGVFTVRPLFQYEHPQKFGWTYQAIYGDAWIKRNVEVPFFKSFVRAGESITHTGVGIIPYYTGLYCFDMLGLLADDVSTWESRSPFGMIPGHRKYAYDRYEGKWVTYRIFGGPKFNLDVMTTRPNDSPDVISIFNQKNGQYFNFLTSEPVEQFRATLVKRGADVYFPSKQERVIFDFESGSYADWIVEGKAFGSAPATESIANQSKISNYRGQRLINSFLNGSDAETGRLTSPKFEIAEDYLTLLVGGGNDPDRLKVELWVDGHTIYSATGNNSETLRPVSWDVRQYRGKRANLVIVDEARGDWGHILVDHIAGASAAVQPLKLISGR